MPKELRKITCGRAGWETGAYRSADTARRQQTLDQREGHVEDHKALDQAVSRGQNGLIHAQDGFQRHVVELDVGRVGDEVVGRHTEQGHGHGTGHGTDDGVLAALVVLVEVTGQCGEHRTA